MSNRLATEDKSKRIHVESGFGKSLEGEQSWPAKITHLVRETGNPIDNIMMIPDPNTPILMH
jgi:hypothetical protein